MPSKVGIGLVPNPHWRDRLPSFGEGWVAEEALAIGVAAALATHDIEEAVLAAVNHSGDSDSTGSICGNILGAALGIGAWRAPNGWSTLIVSA